MRVRILDLDGSLPLQQALLAHCQPRVFGAREWGPAIRLACSFRRFHRFEQRLATLFGSMNEAEPVITFYGSGDFHHVSLALLRRLAAPINLLVLDNHPDWMRGVPFLHCGTWLYHAARLSHVKRIFHVGGEVDFDNYYQWMAPWRLLHGGKIVVFPALRRFQRGPWSAVWNEPIRPHPDTPTCSSRIEELLDRYRAELASRPLYISVDKDVMGQQEAVVNWDSGHLTLAEVHEVLDAFSTAALGNLTGFDSTGDWSPVHVRGLLRHVLHWTEHPSLAIAAPEALHRNETTNLQMVSVQFSAPATCPASEKKN